MSNTNRSWQAKVDLESNTWCPRSDGGDDSVGSAVHVKGFGPAFVSARKRLMAAWRSTTDTPRSNRVVVPWRFSRAYFASLRLGFFCDLPPRPAREPALAPRASLGTQHSGCRFTYRPCS